MTINISRSTQVPVDIVAVESLTQLVKAKTITRNIKNYNLSIPN